MAGFKLLGGTSNAWPDSYLFVARMGKSVALRNPLSAAVMALKGSETGDIRSDWLWRMLPLRYRAGRMNAFYAARVKHKIKR
jgi:hypothetical protein